jgi:poly(hydroxyalkanoate) depolymerase family esterase
MTALDQALESDRPRADRSRRRRWPWIVAGVVLVLAVAVGAGIAVFQFGLPWWKEEGDRNHRYTSDAGSQRYQVHLPPQYDGTTQLPVIMAIHGCGMSGYGWNSMKSTTQFNGLADREGFIVVYPTQRMFRSAINCWNSADPREQHRYAGEPALLAGVALQVVEEYNADPDHVHVAGASSGAGTAVILAATYPDVFATATSVAGGEYGLNQVDPDDPGSTPPDYTARQAWSQMGERARQLPLLVIQGEEDDVVPPLVATRLVDHWTAVSDLVDDGLLNDSLDLVEETTTGPAEQGRHAYTHTTITTPDGTSVVESYLVHGMGHAWPGPAGDGLFTDRAGPDASAIVWDFAQRHPKGSAMKTISLNGLDISHTTGLLGLDLTGAARRRSSWLEAS